MGGFPDRLDGVPRCVGVAALTYEGLVERAGTDSVVLHGTPCILSRRSSAQALRTFRE
jgi:hypothetical protein